MAKILLHRCSYPPPFYAVWVDSSSATTEDGRFPDALLRSRCLLPNGKFGGCNTGEGFRFPVQCKRRAPGKISNSAGARLMGADGRGRCRLLESQGQPPGIPVVYRCQRGSEVEVESNLEQGTRGVRLSELTELFAEADHPPVVNHNSRHIFQTGGPRAVSHQVKDASRVQNNDRRPQWSSDLDCEHFARCSGCVLDSALDRPHVLRDAVAFFKNYGIGDFGLTSGDLWEWRCRAKLAVRGTSENPMIGLFEEGSHTIVNIPNCRAHHPRINAAAELVKEAIKELGVEPYSEETETGHLRYVQLVVSTYNTSLPADERYTNAKVQVTLVWNARDENSPQAKLLQSMAEFLWRKGGSRCSAPILHSVWANFQTSSLNAIFGGRWRHLLGDQEMWERIAGADICFTPASFGQANLQAFQALVRKLQTFVKKGSAVVELYAGVGAIGISLAAKGSCRSVKCVEINKESRVPFELSLSRLSDSVSGKISWHCADASVTPISWLEGADVVIVDPPRKGLDASVIEALRTASLRSQGKLKSASPHVTAKIEKRPWVVRAIRGGVTKESSGRWDDRLEPETSWPSSLIYVSCGWQSFKQDCSALVEDNAWHVHEAHAFNFFPGTDSIEVLAVFKPGKNSKKGRSSSQKAKMGMGKKGKDPQSQKLLLKGRTR